MTTLKINQGYFTNHTI